MTYSFFLLASLLTPIDYPPIVSNDLPVVLSAQDEAQLSAMAKEVEETFDRDYKESLDRMAKEVERKTEKEETRRKKTVWKSFKKGFIRLRYCLDPLGLNLKNLEKNND